jgi:hypothetical protein
MGRESPARFLATVRRFIEERRVYAHRPKQPVRRADTGVQPSFVVRFLFLRRFVLQLVNASLTSS